MEQLLTTKLKIPPARMELVLRPHLVALLNQGLRGKLTLISAPAGFGKTTLVSEWVQAIRAAAPSTSIAWLSLDEDDNDLARFLAYFIAAINQSNGIGSTLGEGALSILQSQQPPLAETVLISLINEIAAIPDRMLFVLDDFHLVEAQPIHDALFFFLENIPPQMHLVIATRMDPGLHLSRLRARGQLTELRASDLRFSAAEAAEFLNRVMCLGLSPEDITALETRTEGWIAGLQLAALAIQGLARQAGVSIQGSKDASEFIKSFTGSHRYVLDYLIEEVLEQQSESIQTFLLQTAILDQLSGPLCDAITGRENGQETLEALERANLFLVALDEERKWYRYHHLFADLLRKRLRQTQPEQKPGLHLMASEWYKQNGFTAQAIEHSLKAEDFDRAAFLAELVWPEMHKSYRGVTWLRWVEAIPDELVRARPVLSTGYGWSLIDTGDLEGADLRLRDAERWLEVRADRDGHPEVLPVKQVNLDQQTLRSLSASIANARAYLTQAFGDVAATEKYARRALDLTPEDDLFERGLSAILLGFAYWSSGNLEAAHRSVCTAISNMQVLGKIRFMISFTSYLADIMIAQGCLNETKNTYLQLLDIAADQGKPEMRETAVVHLGLSELFLEQGDLQAARWHLLRSEELGELPTFPPWYRHWVLAHVRILQIEGKLNGIFKILNDADQLYYRHPIPDVRPLAALIARAQLFEGRLAEAMLWVSEQGLSSDDDLSYLREFEHLTLARVLIAQYQRDKDDGLIQDTIGLLERLLKASQKDGRMGSVIEITLLQALAYEAKGDISLALTLLEQALRLAEPEGYLRIFVDEGPPMARLLFEALKLEIAPAYVRRLLAAFPVAASEQTKPAPSPDSESELIEPLSEREIEVLQLIAEGLTGPEIATRLILSPHTVKAHTRNIFGKLDVHTRTQAIVRSQALGILSPG